MQFNSTSLVAEQNNCTNLGERHTDDINGSIGAPEKTFSISFSKSKTKF